jgi:membrane protease YdiL (CAAX protease family)
LRWLAVVILVPLCLGAVAVGLYTLTTGNTPQLVLLSQPLSIIAYFFAILFFFGPVPEEFGWRGYLLDRLQARWIPLVASLLLGVIWAVWHLPSWFIDGTFQSSTPFWAFLIFTIALSVLFTWVYNHTGGTLALALLFHTMFDLANALFVYVEPGSGANTTIFIYLTALYAVTAALVAVFSRSLGLARQNASERR